MDALLEASPQMTEETWLGALERATNDYVAKGVTTAHDGGVTTPMWRNYMLAHKRGMLKNRVQLLPKHGYFDFSLAPTTRCGAPLTSDGLLSMGAVKLFQDGSLQGYTGYLSNPYHRAPENLPGRATCGAAIRFITRSVWRTLSPAITGKAGRSPSTATATRASTISSRPSRKPRRPTRGPTPAYRHSLPDGQGGPA